MTPDDLIRTLQHFLSCASTAQVFEGGDLLFDFADARYSVSGEHNKCLLHLWSAERNIVRRVLDAHVDNHVLKLAVQRLGQNKPVKLEICREPDRRTGNAKRQHRQTYGRVLRLVLSRHFSEYSVADFRTAADLEHSFGPTCVRGLLRRGQSAFAFLGINQEETQASIDAALTFGILWLDLCRHNQAGRCVVEGLKLFVPSGRSAVVRERMACLSPAAAKWELLELNERDHSLHRSDIDDRGNLSTRLVHLPNENAGRERFAAAIDYVRALMPECESALLSPTELAFRCFGLEFARARLVHEHGSPYIVPEIVFGLGGGEKKLSEKTQAEFARLIRSIGEVRHAEGPRDSALWRLHPERWLESLVVKSLASLDEHFLGSQPVYSQVPAFSASDRAMIDVLTCTRQGRLAVLELKADEDIHLPLQGLDYWSRVAWHHSRGEFQKFGYFAGVELSPDPPLLFLVAPSLRVHPATDAILRYLSPAVEWILIGIDERWRQCINPVFRKRAAPALPGSTRGAA